MGLGLDGVSASDIEKQRMIQSPPAFEPGFGGEQSVSSDFDSLSDDDAFGSFGGSSGGDSFDFNSFGGSSDDGLYGGSSDNPFGGSNNNNPFASGNNNPFGQSYGDSSSAMGQQAQGQADSSEKVFAYLKETFSFILEVVGSIKNRNVDDWASLSSLWMTIGGIMGVLGIVLTLVGTLGDISALKLAGFGGTSLFGGLMVLSCGLAGLGVNTYLKARGGEYATTGGSLQDMQSVQEPAVMQGLEDDSVFGFSDSGEEDEDDSGSSNEENSGADEMSDLLNSVFGESSSEALNFPTAEAEPEKEEEEEKPKDVDYNDLQNGIREDVGYVNRGMLFDTFKDFFPLNSIGFTDVKQYDLGDKKVLQMGHKINEALAILLPDKDPEVREVQIESMTETHFAFKVVFSRLKVKLKQADFEKELENQLKDSIDSVVPITLNILASKNILLISKESTSPVTIGDCLRKDVVEDYIRNTKVKLPFIAGLTDLGEVKLADMKSYMSIIITGKPRSGKSWYVNSILSTLVAFNTPEDIQFIVVDPKKTSLFKTFSYLPHVCGLHDGENILDLFKDVVENEAERRKKLLSDAGADNIWEYKEDYPDVKLPVLMFVIDEIVTIYNNLKKIKQEKQFSEYVQTIFTQLPYVGIGLMMIPHRTTGIIDKLVRMNVSYKATVMSDAEGIKEEMDTTKFSRPLVSPGDMAVKASDWPDAIYLKGTGVALQDKDVRKLLREMAKAWYKIGVEQPDLSKLELCVNRDEDKVKEELQLGDSNRIQYSTLDLD